ncbi:hypothetical protein GCM10008020_39340 [Massilia psychrophila]|nr:hypothetical protein GCM10008020_39340 [Massilia psychrophila]
MGFRGRIHPAQLEAAVQICEANRDGTKRERGKVFRYHLKTEATRGRSIVGGGRFKLSRRKLQVLELKLPGSLRGLGLSTDILRPRRGDL